VPDTAAAHARLGLHEKSSRKRQIFCCMNSARRRSHAPHAPTLYGARRLLLVLGIWSFAASAAEVAPDFSKLSPLPPCPELVAAAQARQIPLDRIDPPGEAGRLEPGDSFTGLVTLCEKGGRRTQWLFYLTALPGSPKELAGKAPEPLVLYSGRSNRLEFASAPALVRLRTLGPFAASDSRKKAKLEDQSVTFSLNKGFLGLGLERAAATLSRMDASKTGGAFWYSSDPPDAAQVAKSRKADAFAHLTPEEDRALGGAIPALLSYVDVIQHTEGLEDIMLRVIEKPSIWSVIEHLGVSADLMFDAKHLGPADLTPFGIGGHSSAYYFPMLFKLNHRLALTVTFLVTDSRPPLLSCGGIVGLLAERPGDKETYLTLRIISARCAPAAPDP
jgi:hypothetical protein